MSKANTKSAASARYGVDNFLYAVLSAGSVRQRAAEEILVLERSSSRRRTEPAELAKWRVIGDYRQDLLRSIEIFPREAEKHAEVVAQRIRDANGDGREVTKARKELRKAYNAAAAQCVHALEQLDAAIRSRPARSTQPDAIIEMITSGKLLVAMRAARYYLQQKQSKEAWIQAEFALITITTGERSRERVDDLIRDARAEVRSTGRSATHENLARYVVAKLAKLAVNSKKLRA